MASKRNQRGHGRRWTESEVDVLRLEYANAPRTRTRRAFDLYVAERMAFTGRTASEVLNKLCDLGLAPKAESIKPHPRVNLEVLATARILHADGYTYSEICAIFDRHGIPPTRGQKWSALALWQSVRRNAPSPIQGGKR